MDSLFTPLKNEGLTTLKLRYDYKTDTHTLFAARLWDDDIDFSRYNKDFYVESILTNNAVYLNGGEVRALYEKYGLSGYLDKVLELMRKGKHFGMDCYYDAKHEIHFMGNMHSRRLGVNNKYHATLAGGIRRHGLDEEELDVIIDGLNLSRAMSFKNIAAGISFGGSKTTVQMDPLDVNDMNVMGFLAYALDSLRTMTGPDMNFPTVMADVMNENFSMSFNGGPSSKIGETGKPTAYGVYLALRAARKIVYGSDSLEGLKMAVQGLGSLGWYFARHLLDAGAVLTVADIDPARCEKLSALYPGRVTVCSVGEIAFQDVDVFCPCAIGGVISDDNINAFRCPMIFGGANNQLRASSQEEEIRLANKLRDRGIFFEEAWWHNCAGVMAGCEDYIYGENASYDELCRKIEARIPASVTDNITRAIAHGITPTEEMYRYCENKIYGE